MKRTLFSSIGLAATLLATSSLASAAMPTPEEMWEIIQQQQREIEALKQGQKENTEQCRQYAANGHNGVQFALHNQKPLMANIVVAISVIDE